MSKYADEGTIAHALAAMCLEEGKDALAYVGRIIESEDYEHSPLGPSSAHRWMRCPGSTALIAKIRFVPRKFGMAVTVDMAAAVQVYLDNVRAYETPGADALTEQKLDISDVIGVADHYGTADRIILDHAAEELQVHDLKFGKGVAVSAFENEQMLIYAAAALRQFGPLMESVKRVRMVIHQPRVNEAPDEWDLPVEDVIAFEAKARAAAGRSQDANEQCDTDRETWEGENLVYGEKQCKFCDAKPTCPEHARKVSETVFGDFEALDQPAPQATVPLDAIADKLHLYLPHLAAIESWCSAVAAAAEAKLLAGEPIPGYKLVAGRKGARAWVSKDAAEELLKSFRMKHDEMYDYSVISPTTAEKRLAKDHPRQWEKAKTLVTQSEGRPSVAPESDKRPALEVKPVIDDFQEVSA